MILCKMGRSAYIINIKVVEVKVSMAFVVGIIPIFLIIGLFLFGFRNRIPGMKFMILGISIILFGGILAVDPDTNLSGIEYLIAFLGLIITIVGFGKND